MALALGALPSDHLTICTVQVRTVHTDTAGKILYQDWHHHSPVVAGCFMLLEEGEGVL